MISRRFLKFLLAGGIAALANFASRIVFSNWVAYVPAIILAYLIGMVTAFVLNRLFVFQSTSNGLHSQIGWFTLVNLAAVTQTLIISILLARFVFPATAFREQGETIAHAIGVAVPAVTSYIGHKYLSFRH